MVAKKITSVGCLDEDRWRLKQIAADRGLKIYELVHEMTNVAAVNKVVIHADPNATPQKKVPSSFISTLNDFFGNSSGVKK